MRAAREEIFGPILKSGVGRQKGVYALLHYTRGCEPVPTAAPSSLCTATHSAMDSRVFVMSVSWLLTRLTASRCSAGNGS